MKKNLVLFLATVCTLAFGGFFAVGQVFAAGASSFVTYNGSAPYFDVHTLKFMTTSGNGADVNIGSLKYFVGVNGATIQDIGAVNIDNAEAPASGYSSGQVAVQENNTYVIKCKDGNYGFIRVVTLNDNGTAELLVRTTAKIQSTPAPKPKVVKAVHTNSSVLVNGKKVAFKGYNIGGSNYFKLRDIAMALASTEKKFEVVWNSNANAMSLITGMNYNPTGTELVNSSDVSPKNATLTTSKIYVNDDEVDITAYNINNNNYFMLRDVGKAINFGVTWDPKNNAILINTNESYEE